MPGYEDRIKGLETSVGNIRETLGEIKGQLDTLQKPAKSSHPLLAVIGSALCLAILWYWGWVGTQVVKQGNQITQILTTLSPETIKDASLHPDDPKSAKRAEQALKLAEQQGKQLDAGLIADAGTKFVNASDENPAAWNVAMMFVDYRSRLSVYNRQVTLTSAPPPGTVSRYDMGPQVDSKPAPQLSFTQVPVIPFDAARFETIGKNLNASQDFGAEEIWLTGGAVSLDDKYIRHAVLKNVEVHYSGKRLMMEDVFFINCTFIFDNTPAGRNLGEALLASSSVSFETSG